ncbi:hypothetical protein NX059_002287 [Plenodomus lindquistii]|nr:hypothetical protein NX059_002287 [Plenodomus lindquistii]
MVAASIWSSLIASAACVSAFVVPDELSGVGAPLLCGTKTSTPSRVVRRSEAKKAFIPRQATNSSTLLPIDVYMQIISSDGTPEGGDISDERIDAQMKILNEAFVPVGFQFNLVETIRTINEEWFSNLQVETPYETEVPQALKKGGNATLNVYTIGNTQAFAAAWSSLPYELQYQPIFDGIYMNHTMMIGGGNINGGNATFNRGKTLVHEAGHWFGLYHIFGYTCDMSYDYVSLVPDRSSSLINIQGGGYSHRTPPSTLWNL